MNMILTASHKWLSKEIECNLVGIQRCTANCCKGLYFYPSKSNIDKDGNPIGYCKFLTPTGCSMSVKQKPLKCLLYPLIIKNNRLILHGRAICSVCRNNYKKGGKSILEQNKDNLSEVFGEEIVLGMMKSILENHKDFKFTVPINVQMQLEKEDQLEKLNQVPVPR